MGKGKSERYIIEVGQAKNSTYPFRAYLRRFGTYDKKTRKWMIETFDPNCIKTIRKFCRKHKLQFLVYPESAARSEDYRGNFLAKHKTRDGRYRCAYCLRKFPQEQITVDHIIPVHRAKRSKWARLLLKLFGCRTVNDDKNLVPACRSCNSRKGTKGGIWVFKGWIGSGRGVPVVCGIIVFIIICILFILILCRIYLPG